MITKNWILCFTRFSRNTCNLQLYLVTSKIAAATSSSAIRVSHAGILFRSLRLLTTGDYPHRQRCRPCFKPVDSALRCENREGKKTHTDVCEGPQPPSSPTTTTRGERASAHAVLLTHAHAQLFSPARSFRSKKFHRSFDSFARRSRGFETVLECLLQPRPRCRPPNPTRARAAMCARKAER